MTKNWSPGGCEWGCMCSEVLAVGRDLTLGPVVLWDSGESCGTSRTQGNPIVQQGLGSRVSHDFPWIWVSRDFARWVTSIQYTM